MSKEKENKIDRNEGALPSKAEVGDRCVVCGAEIPEGRQVCPICEEKKGQSGGSIHTPKGGREIDILNMLPAEALPDAERLALEFLEERGYDAIGALEDEEKLRALNTALVERGEEIYYRGGFNTDDKTGVLTSILIWYELYREGRFVARSRGFKLVPSEAEDTEEVAADEK
jgi:cell division protein ZapA (FtsZ GTPase activity inhibitor)